MGQKEKQEQSTKSKLQITLDAFTKCYIAQENMKQNIRKMETYRPVIVGKTRGKKQIKRKTNLHDFLREPNL